MTTEATPLPRKPAPEGFTAVEGCSACQCYVRVAAEMWDDGRLMDWMWVSSQGGQHLVMTHGVDPSSCV
jgi:hypothetical protein